MDTIRKSATSTEVFLVPVMGREDGELINPTFGTVKAATLRQSLVTAQLQYVPETAEYVTMTWSTRPGERYDAEVLLGPDGDLDPEGPSGTSTAPIRHQLWLEWTYGSEVVRRQVAWVMVTR